MIPIKTSAHIKERPGINRYQNMIEWDINNAGAVSGALIELYKNVHTSANLLNQFWRHLAEIGVSKEVLGASRRCDLAHLHNQKMSKIKKSAH